MKNTESNAILTSTTFMGKEEIPFNRILIIDDSEVDFFIANTLIKRHKPAASLFYAPDVDSALNMIRSFKTNEMPDLILLDLNFDNQKKQGVDFLREYESMPSNTRTGTRLIVLTAYAGYRGTRAFASDQFIQKIIEKPFSVEKLLSH